MKKLILTLLAMTFLLSACYESAPHEIQYAVGNASEEVQSVSIEYTDIVSGETIYTEATLDPGSLWKSEVFTITEFPSVSRINCTSHVEDFSIWTTIESIGRWKVESLGWFKFITIYENMTPVEVQL